MSVTVASNSAMTNRQLGVQALREIAADRVHADRLRAAERLLELPDGNRRLTAGIAEHASGTIPAY